MESEINLTGSPDQVEWALRIRLTVALEFDRVAKVFQAQLRIQTAQKQAETRAIISILEEKGCETLANGQAGYFIRDWQEPGDQLRQMIAKDSRYLAIRDQRNARRRATI